MTRRLTSLTTDARLPRVGVPLAAFTPIEVCSRFPVTQATYIEQPNRTYCSASVLSMALRALGYEAPDIPFLAKELKTTPRWGTNNETLARVTQAHFPGWRVTTSQMTREQTDVPFGPAPWREQVLSEVRGDLFHGAFVIVNYREPRDQVGHFAIVQSIAADDIRLADPIHGLDYRVPLAQFDWRSGFSNPVRCGWRLLIHPHND